MLCLKMEKILINKTLARQANISGYATYESLCCAQHNKSIPTKRCFNSTIVRVIAGVESDKANNMAVSILR